MKVLLVGNYAADGQQSMQRFAELFVRELPKHGVAAELIRPEPRFNLTQSPRGVGKYLGYLDKLLVFSRTLQKRAGAGDCVVHICDHSNAFYTRHLQEVPHLVTCHDLLAVRSALGEFPQNPTRWSGKRLQKMIVDGLGLARHIVCVSEATRADLLRVTMVPPDRTEVIYNGLNHQYSALPPDAAQRILERYHLPPRFVLHVGSDHWYKNRRGVLEIYADVRKLDGSVPPLVLAGAPLSALQRDAVLACAIEKDVIAFPHPSNEELRALYSRADMLLFPSLIEGFGWPIIEAQACGCPVVTSNVAPMTEIAGDAATYIDPGDAMGAARRVVAMLQEGHAGRFRRAERSILNAARFSTDAMVEAYVRVYGRLLNKTLQFEPAMG